MHSCIILAINYVQQYESTCDLTNSKKYFESAVSKGGDDQDESEDTEF